MTTEKIQVDGNKIIEAIGGTERVHEILDVMGIDLHDARESLIDGCEWHCGVEGKWWPITGKLLYLTDEYAVRWTDTDEAGVDDVEIIERLESEKDDADSLGEWLREIACNVGSCDGSVR